MPAWSCPIQAALAPTFIGPLQISQIGHTTMAISIIVSDTVGIKVAGTINNATGTPVPFNFNLICTRMDADQIQEKLKIESDASLTDFLASVTTGWSGVKGADEQFLDYSEANLRRLCKLPGMAAIAFHTYLSEAGAKAKN